MLTSFPFELTARGPMATDEGPVDRFHNRYRSPRIPPNEQWRKYNLASLKQPPVKLGSQRRADIEKAIRETCKIRGWVLLALNARTNHIHTVVSANCKPEPILNGFKANATREMMEAGCWLSDRSPWIPRGSKKYLWDEESVSARMCFTNQENRCPDCLKIWHHSCRIPRSTTQHCGSDQAVSVPLI